MPSRSWLTDFEYAQGALLVKKTGARVPLNLEIAHEFFTWLLYFGAIKGRRLSKQRGFTVAFEPAPARPWYLIWPVLQEAGAQLIDDPARADMVFHFDDSTWSATQPPARVKAGAKLVNFGCNDVSKSRVAAAFEAAFGYKLAVDPRTYAGLAVEKTEENGAHTGRIVQCPTEPLEGRTYQRVIDNSIDRGLVEDLRTPTIGGVPACVFLKRRPVSDRFANTNCEVALKTPNEVFTTDEIAGLGRFARQLGLDWGGLDVLRDKTDGRIYIVDANKTDMGPPIALPLAEKLRATDMLAHAVRAYVSRKAA